MHACLRVAHREADRTGSEGFSRCNRFLTIAAPIIALILMAGEGCTLHREGTQEVAAFIQERHLAVESEGQDFARKPMAVAAGSAVIKDSAAADESAESETLETLRAFIVAALDRNPEIQAAEQTARSRAERIAQVTALPDPLVSTKTLPEPVRTAEGDNFFIAGISERFPVPQKLDRAGRIALEEARVALYRLQEVRLRVIAEVKRAYFRLYVLDKSIDITKDNQRLLRGLIDVARARVAAGRRPQDDVLRATVELSNLEAELITLRQRRVTAAARLNELLDRDPGTPIAPIEGFDLRRADLSLDTLLRKSAKANPALRRLEHQIERDKHAVALAKLAYWPDFMIGLEWMQMEPRDAFRPLPNPTTGRRPIVSRLSEDGTDNWAITFGFTLPIWFNKIRSGVNEARLRLLAAQSEYHAAHNRIEARIEDALERVRAQRELAALFDRTIIPQAQQTYQVSLASYVAGSSDFLYVIDNWRKWLVFAIQYHRSLGELERSVADLEETIGLSLSEAGAP